MSTQNEFNIEVKHDGAYGFDYSVTRAGVLLARGWIRCAEHVQAIQLVRDVANKVGGFNP